MHPDEIWNGDGWRDRAIRAALLPGSALYALGWESYLAVYRLGLKHAVEAHPCVMCVGNLVVGGAGKTPVALHLAQLLTELGREVVLSVNGYGGPHCEHAALAPQGPLAASEWGDEPAMMRWLLPEVPMVVGRRRVESAQLATAAYPNSVLLMDDGFQHLPLKKHLTLVLDERTPKNRWCLPSGPYREGRWNRRRADILVPGRFHVVPAPLEFLDPEGFLVPAPAAYSALCALGQPSRYLRALESATERPARQVWTLPDHDPLTGGTLLDALPTDHPTVVTAKDWVKLRERSDHGIRPLLVARHRVQIEPEAEFRTWLKERLDGQTR